ncbi:MAG: hypothetical protein PVF65_05150 [Sphingomonadales bacterium]
MSEVAAGAVPYKWAVKGDINAGFAFLLDCVVNLFVLAAILAGFGFPSDVVQGRIIPGAVVGIVFGNLLYMWMTAHLAKKTGNHQLTSLPLGLDLPTTITFCFGILGPLFLTLKAETGDADYAARIAWYVGMGATIWIAFVKLGLSFIGNTIQRIMPVAALLGSMFGISAVWLGANAILGVMEIAPIGMIALIIMVYSLIGTGILPGKMPGAVIAIVAGTAMYYVLGYTGALEGLGYGFSVPAAQGFGLNLPVPSSGGFEELFGRSLNYLAISVPFALLIAASAVNISTAAKLMGDDYNPKHVIWADSAATFVSGAFGGVVQTTPYFGHTTYKRMGGRVGYAAAAITILALGVVTGVLSFLIELIPPAVFKPILIVVAMDIIRLAFQSIPEKHAPAVGFAIMPAIINFAFVKLDTLYAQVKDGLNGITQAVAGTDAAGAVAAKAAAMFPAFWMAEYVLISAMARGYILTSLLWAAIIVFILERTRYKAAFVLLLAAVFTLFGIIHSVDPNSSIYLPWAIDEALRGKVPDSALALPYQIALGYLLGAVTIILVGLGVKEEEEVK